MNGSTPRSAEIISRRPSVSFGLQNVTPPSNLYVTVAESLVLDAWNDASGPTIFISYRILSPAGEIIEGTRSMQPTTARELSRLRIPLAEGFLLSVTVWNTSILLQRGDCFIQVTVARGLTATPDLLALLIADYLTLNQALGWPGGLPVSQISGRTRVHLTGQAAPAAGAEISIAVPLNARWRLTALAFTLTTAVAVATRHVTLRAGDGVPLPLQRRAEETQTASLVRTYCACSFGSGGPAGTSNITIMLPPDLHLDEALTISTLTENIQAADQFGPPNWMYEEWIQE